MRELDEVGGIPARAARYAENNRLLIERMGELGFEPYIKEYQGPIITTFCYPKGVTFTFADMYEYIKDRGYVIYPGKMTDEDTFRIGNIGDISRRHPERDRHFCRLSQRTEVTSIRKESLNQD